MQGIMKRSVVQVCWFHHGGHHFGIVICKGGDAEPAAYIGVVAGIDEKKDIINIAQYGAKFPLAAAELAIKEKGSMMFNALEIPEK